jgi:hypothetical protein
MSKSGGQMCRYFKKCQHHSDIQYVLLYFGHYVCVCPCICMFLWCAIVKYMHIHWACNTCTGNTCTLTYMQIHNTCTYIQYMQIHTYMQYMQIHTHTYIPAHTVAHTRHNYVYLHMIPTYMHTDIQADTWTYIVRICMYHKYVLVWWICVHVCACMWAGRAPLP